jgi:hypothetical protein
MRRLDDFLPAHEFSERHALAVAAPPERVDRAVREVTLAEMPLARLLLALRGVGRGRDLAGRPLVEAMLRNGVLLEDAPGEGLVLGITGRFWKLRGGFPSDAPRTPEEFAAYPRRDVARAVVDVRVSPRPDARSLLTTETRVHVPDPAARRKFRRYWLVVRRFSGLTRILWLRAAKRRAEAVA